MMVPQRLQSPVILAGQTHIFDLGKLLVKQGGADLNIVEWVLLVESIITQDAAVDVQGWQQPLVLAQVQFIPTDTCYASMVDGWHMYNMDRLLTGRIAYTPPAIGLGTGDITKRIALRLPMHGCGLGAVGKRFLDVSNPAQLWKGGSVYIQVAAAGVFGDPTLVSAQVTLLPVYEADRQKATIGGVMVYGKQTDSAGGSFTYSSAGRTVSVALAPEDRDCSVYTTFQWPDICTVGNLTPFDFAADWNAMKGVSGDADGELDLMAPEMIPLYFGRWGCDPLSKARQLPRGNRDIQSPGNSASEHRLLWAQVRSANQMKMTFAAETGRPIPPPVKVTADTTTQDLAQAMSTADVLPVEVLNPNPAGKLSALE